MRYMTNYFTARDWGILDNKESTSSQRDACVTNRLDALGVRRASEDGLIKWAISILENVEFKITGNWKTYWSVYARVNAIKDRLQGLPPYKYAFVDIYPENPRDLPESIFNVAYDPLDPPIHRHVAGLDSVAKHVPLRKSSKLLHNPESSTATQRPRSALAHAAHSLQSQWGGYSSGSTDSIVVNGIPIHVLGNVRQCDYQSWGSYGGGAHSGGSGSATQSWSWPGYSHHHHGDQSRPALKDNSPPTTVPPRVDTQDDADDHTAGAISGKSDDPLGLKDDRKSSGDIEEEAFQRLMNRPSKRKAGDVQKKPAASPIVKSPAKKKPAAAKAAARKVPRAGPPANATKCDYVVKWAPDKGDSERSRNCFNSLHYGRAKSRFKHLSTPKLNAVLQQVVQQAGAVWDKHMK